VDELSVAFLDRKLIGRADALRHGVTIVRSMADNNADPQAVVRGRDAAIVVAKWLALIGVAVVLLQLVNPSEIISPHNGF